MPPPHSDRRDDELPSNATRIALPPDFDFTWTLGFLARRTVPALEAVGDRDYRRSVRLDGKPVLIEMTVVTTADPGRGRRQALIATARPTMPPATLDAAVRRMLDLDVN